MSAPGLLLTLTSSPPAYLLSEIGEFPASCQDFLARLMVGKMGSSDFVRSFLEITSFANLLL